MSIADFYVHKAEQCVRLADAETDAGKRAALIEEAKLWRGIARDIVRQDRNDTRRLGVHNA